MYVLRRLWRRELTPRPRTILEHPSVVQPTGGKHTGSDGKLIATCRLSNTVEFTRWVMSFGPRARVLKPASLRQEIRGMLRAAVVADCDDRQPWHR